MTGFGTATAEVPGGRLAVEVRSVNHRFSEVLIRLPRDLSPLEDRARAILQERVRRGRVEVVVTREEGARRPRTVRADVELAAAYARALRDLAGAVGAGGDVTVAQVASLPDVLRLEDERADPESLWPQIEAALRAAADGLVAMRASEGERLAAELALFAERSDITEELTRLRSHLVQFRQTVREEDAAVGRKLDFILQEMGRETNTIGSKANDLEITRAIIAMKSELESLREQAQNVE